jgi:dihydropyrimidinase
MAHDLIVRGGLVATATDAVVADLGIRGGRIATIDQGLPGNGREVDARGLVVVPGGVDVHTHLDLDLGGTRTADDFESGTAAAACGGVTTICDYAWQTKGNTLAGTIETWKAKAAGRAHVDYGFHVILSEATDAILRELPALVGAGFPSVKVFTIREFGLPDEALLRVMRAARAAGALVNVHCENSDVLDLAQADLIAAGRTDPRHYASSRPALAEVEATRRVIDYAELVDAEVYIVHISCSGAAEALRAARRRGLRVWGETRPIYLGLTDEAYAKGGVEAAKVCGAPPLRTDRDLEALWDALRSGDIQTIGSDNTSWTVKQKAEGAADFRKIPYGVPGLETEMRVVYSEGVARGRISLQTFVSAFATTPAKLFGLYPRKGTIAVGSDADLLLLDPAGAQTIDERTLHSRAGYDPFHGFEIRGVPRLTLSRGEVIARDGQLLSRPGRGQLVLRQRARG